MECYACGDEATRQCRRCARVYCDIHGGDLCAECLNPASSLPSFNLYRGSLLALLIGTAVAIWLLVRPLDSDSGGGVVLADLTPDTIVTEVVSTPTVEDEETPAPETPDVETPTEGRTATPAPADTAGPREYFVESGDTLIGIAERFAPPGVLPFDYAQEIATRSGLVSIDTPITPGQKLVLP